MFVLGSFGTILLCRPAYSREPAHARAAGWGNVDKALFSANTVTRITEDLLATEMIQRAQVHR